MIEIVMPRLSDSMEEGTILRWLVADGDEVHRGDELLEVETDKAAMIHVSDADGILEILAPEGSTHAVGETIGRLLPVEAKAPDAKSAPEEGVGEPEPEPAADEPIAVADGQPVDETEGAAVPAPATVAARSGASRVHASPVARRLAEELGVDLEAITGSGPNGRIVRDDVEAAAGNGAAPTAPTGAPGEDGTDHEPALEEPPAAEAERPSEPGREEPSTAPTAGAPAAATTAKGAVTRIEPTRSQSLIARRMSESRATVPDFTLEAEVDAGRLADLREQLRELAGESRAPSVGDLVTRACALALRDHPEVNGSWRDGAFEHYGRINVGIAVATDDGLVVPVIFDADRKDIHEIAEESSLLAQRARAGTITPPELSGGTFSISNLGMFGVDRFTAVINPPQAAILSVGAMREVPVVHEGEVVPGMTMALALAVDHRAVYGAAAARFLASVRERLAAPAALLG